MGNKSTQSGSEVEGETAAQEDDGEMLEDPECAKGIQTDDEWETEEDKDDSEEEEEAYGNGMGMPLKKALSMCLTTIFC